MDKELLEWAHKAIQEGVKYVPVMVDQYLRWWLWTHIFWLIIGGLLVLYAALDTRWLRKRWDDLDTDEFSTGFSIFSLIITTLVGVPMVFANIYYLIKIKVAPAVYIIDSLTGK